MFLGGAVAVVGEREREMGKVEGFPLVWEREGEFHLWVLCGRRGDIAGSSLVGEREREIVGDFSLEGGMWLRMGFLLGRERERGV